MIVNLNFSVGCSILNSAIIIIFEMTFYIYLLSAILIIVFFLIAKTMATKPVPIEAGILDKIEKIDVTIKLINQEISKQLIRKSRELKISLTQDLKEKCDNYILGPEKVYQCKICWKIFDEGRKLGGHVSRAHKDYPKQ
jgi:cell division protein FtsL